MVSRTELGPDETPAGAAGAEEAARRETALGVGYALLAYTAWGFAPLFWKVVAVLPALEVLAHRIVWSAPLLIVFVWALRRWRDVLRALSSRRILLPLVASATLMVANWGIFIVAVQLDRVLEVSLGYFINPLVSVLLAVIFIGERLRLWQGVAVAIAAAGVINQTIAVGSLPWFALGLAFSFGTYGLVRKLVQTDALVGLTVETALFMPLAIGYFVYLGATGAGIGAADLDPWRMLAVVMTGAMTVIPLLWFVAGARRIRYSTMGLIQYLAPTGHLLLAVFVFGETFTVDHMITFGCIWLALVLYTADSMRAYRRQQTATAA